MINQYGADAVRWFILSDSPPEKDVQWSDTGVDSANKFLQKIWNLNYLISQKKEGVSDDKINKKVTLEINNFVIKIDDSINNFRFNVTIANFYQVYNTLKNYLNLEVSKQTLTDCIIKIMKQMLPFTPHLANECLELFKCQTVNSWPRIDKNNILDEINLAVQINGKTRDIIKVKSNLVENEINKIILRNSKAKKYLESKKVIKTIFVKNKIINYIIQGQ